MIFEYRGGISWAERLYQQFLPRTTLLFSLPSDRKESDPAGFSFAASQLDLNVVFQSPL